MKNEQHIENAMASLREADRGKAAPDFLETRLCSAFRQQHDRKPARGFAWRLWAGGALAGLIAGAAVYRVAMPAGVEAPAPVAVSSKVPPPSPTSLPPTTLPPTTRVPPKQHVIAAAVNKPKPRRAARPPQPVETFAASAHSETEEFMAIPYAPRMTAQDRGEVIRVRLPRQSIRSMGIPVNADRLFEKVPADLLVGEDGIPRGIRLVRSESR